MSSWGHHTTAEWHFNYFLLTWMLPSQHEALESDSFEHYFCPAVKYLPHWTRHRWKKFLTKCLYQTLPEATWWEVAPWSPWLGCLHSRATRTCGLYFGLAHIPTALWALGVASAPHLGGKTNKHWIKQPNKQLSPKGSAAGFLPDLFHNVTFQSRVW